MNNEERIRMRFSREGASGVVLFLMGRRRGFIGCKLLLGVTGLPREQLLRSEQAAESRLHRHRCAQHDRLLRQAEN